MSQNEEARRFAELDAELSKVGVAGADLCDIYAKAKPIIQFLLPIIEILPYGKVIVKLIKMLMQLADTACGTS